MTGLMPVATTVGPTPSPPPAGKFSPIASPLGWPAPLRFQTTSSRRSPRPANGGLAYLSYFAATFQGGYGTYSSDDVNAAVAYIAYGTGIGTAPAALVAIIEANMAAYPGPWAITLAPPSGGTYTSGTNYNGDVTVTAANGTGVPGLAINPPATGGAGEWTNFTWEPNVATDVTDAAGHLPFAFNQSTASSFSEVFSIVGGAPGTAPIDYAPPAGSGAQTLLAAVAPASPTSTLTGTVTSSAPLKIAKSTNDPSYVPATAGVVFNVLDAANTVVDTLTTVTGGVAGPSLPNLTPGDYTIVEVSVPAGSGLAINTTPTPFTVTPADVSGATPVTLTVPVLDSVIPGSIVLTKTDSDTGVGLPGAQFSVYYDSLDNGSFTTQIVGPNPGGTFSTAANGTIIDPSGALGLLLPGDYQITETVAPPGHALPSPADHVVTIPIGGGPVSANFADKTIPTITTSATAVNQVGSSIGDVATLTASVHATGTIIFDAYGPFTSATGATCTAATLAFTSAPVTVSGSGTYQWVLDSHPPPQASTSGSKTTQAIRITSPSLDPVERAVSRRWSYRSPRRPPCRPQMGHRSTTLSWSRDRCRWAHSSPRPSTRPLTPAAPPRCGPHRPSLRPRPRATNSTE